MPLAGFRCSRGRPVSHTKHRRAIRTKNTLLAASGAVLLSIALIFGELMGQVHLPRFALLLGLASFWLGNLAIIFTITSGVSERWQDPSLSAAQMYWATAACLCAMFFMPAYSLIVYFLLFLIAIFGVFRIAPVSFIVFSLVQCVALAGVLYWQQQVGWARETLLEASVIWAFFACCQGILLTLCRNMATLRRRLRAKNMDLQDALETRKQFLANISHEIRTPMNGVLGMLELLGKSQLDSTQRRFVSVARSSGEALVMLINDVLDFAKMEAGRFELSGGEFNLRRMASKIAQGFYYLAQQKGLGFEVSIDPAIPDAVLGDEIRVRQVMNNLLGNALKFTDKGELVFTLSLIEKKNDEIRVACSVRDTGIGIDESQQEKVFESFSQADLSNTRAYGGTGLGLPIARKLCQMMQGDLIVKSRLGQGSTFTATFAFNCEQVSASRPGSLAGKSILVVDDHPDRSFSMARVVQFLGGRALVVSPSDISMEAILEQVMDHQVSGIVIHHQLRACAALPLVHKLSHLPGTATLAFAVVSHDPELPESVSIPVLSEPLSAESLYQAMAPGAAPKKAENDQNTSILSTESSKHSNLVNGMKVLLVEDNKTNQEVAMMLLEDCEVDVDVADDGVEALDKLRQSEGAYDLVFMDCQMPNMDGYDATRAIRKGEAGSACRDIPIIAMTANALAGDREKCLDAGMNDYISKPISFEVVEEKLERWQNGS